MYYQYSPLSNTKVKVIRYGVKTLVNGIYSKDAPVVLEYRATVVPITNIKNVKDKYGDEVQAAIFYASNIKNALNIETDKTSNDFIYWDDKFWKVVWTINHRIVLKHTEAEAVLITHPSDELRGAVSD